MTKRSAPTKKSPKTAVKTPAVDEGPCMFDGEPYCTDCAEGIREEAKTGPVSAYEPKPGDVCAACEEPIVG